VHSAIDWSRFVTTLVAACGIALAGCSEPAPTPPGSGTRTLPASPSTQAEPAGASSSARMPAAGQADLDVDEETITLLANAAPRRELLERLATELEFELHAPDVGDEPITVNGVEVEFRDLLPQLLPDRAYRVAYRHDPRRNAHQVERLEVARLGERTALYDARDTDEPVLERVVPYSARTRSRQSRDESDVSPEQSWRETLDQLDDSDWEERLEAIERIEPEGEGLAILIGRLADDPSPKVRAAAATQLEDSDTLLAVDALVRALNDPDKEVVLDAIDALEFTDDETVADDLEPLEDHPDPDISEAATEAICFIRDCG
jgi:hypothetical protein